MIESRYVPENPVTIEARSVPEVYVHFNLDVPPTGRTTHRLFNLYLGPKSATVFDEQVEYDRFQSVMIADLEPFGCCNFIPGVVTLC